MSIDALIILVGALIAVMPFLGFPISWQVWIFFILGIVVVVLGIAVRRRGDRSVVQSRRKGEFVESMPAGVMSHDIESRHDTHNQRGNIRH